MLTDENSSFNRNRTDSFSGSIAVYRGRHNITVGGDLRKQQYNDFFQANPRGIFTFTGAATQGTANNSGSDLADFLIGVPDTSAVAFGNADKYLRQPAYDLYAADDWRILPNLTINAGLRWEYGAPDHRAVRAPGES
jgi:outer membrane receptor for ferrienterochelin and colicin